MLFIDEAECNQGGLNSNLPECFKNPWGIVEKCYGEPLRVVILQNIDSLSSRFDGHIVGY